MKLKEIKDLLEIAVDTAKGASVLLKSDPSCYRQTKKKLRHDVKIEADFASENYIVNRLSKQTKYPILSEESKQLWKKENNTGHYWIVDPLDGSINYLRGIPICCISIALWNNLEPILGVVYDFNRDELFSGIVDVGAWLNGVPVTVSGINIKSNAVLCTGFPVSTDFSEEKLLEFVGNIRNFMKIRLLGSAALSLSYVACGRADYYYERGIKLWDVAAGVCLVKAAGGFVNLVKTSNPFTFNVTASNFFLKDL